MSELILARRQLYTALSTAMARALAIYAEDPTSSNFDTIASLTEACSSAGLPLKKSHREGVGSIAHYENPYYYIINPDTGAVRHTIGGGIPAIITSTSPIGNSKSNEGER